MILHQPLKKRIAHNADAVRIGDKNRTIQKSGLLQPVRSRHVAIAVLREKSPKNRIVGLLSARPDDGYAGPHGVALNDRPMADLNAGHVCDPVERSSEALERYAKIAGPGLGLGSCTNNSQRHQNN